MTFRSFFQSLKYSHSYGHSEVTLTKGRDYLLSISHCVILTMEEDFIEQPHGAGLSCTQYPCVPSF